MSPGSDFPHTIQYVVQCSMMYGKTCVNGHSKIDKTKIFMTNVASRRSRVLQNAPLGAFCNTFDLHLAIISLENQLFAFMIVAVFTEFTVELFSFLFKNMVCKPTL